MGRAWARTVAVVLGVAGLSCQVYDFQPVTPATLAQTTFVTLAYAQALKPNLYLLVDTSGSMNKPVPGGGTRLSVLQGALEQMLADAGTVARMGLATFPSDSSCGPTVAPALDLPAPTAGDVGTDATLQAQASAITTLLQGLTPNGGTPTAASLAVLGALPSLNDPDSHRPSYVLLLTDGLPNCNSGNPNSICSCGPGSSFCAGEAACSCTIDPRPDGTSGCRTAPCAPGVNCNCQIGCLDQDASTRAIVALQKKGIGTIVVGFGSDTAGAAAVATLNAMALAGGVPRACTGGADAECGAGDRCNTVTRLCDRRFYQASTGAELSAALARILGVIRHGNPCAFVLDAQPDDPSYLAVFIDGQSVAPGPGSWSYSAGEVTFAESSAVCRRIHASTRSNGVQVEIRVLQRL